MSQPRSIDPFLKARWLCRAGAGPVSAPSAGVTRDGWREYLGVPYAAPPSLVFGEVTLDLDSRLTIGTGVGAGVQCGGGWGVTGIS